MNLQALATSLGVSTKTIASWVRKGVPHTRSKTGVYVFNLKAVQRWRDQTLSPRRSTDDGPTSYYAARARKETALAGLRELQLKVRTGELVTAISVRQASFTMHRRVRDRMDNIPSRVSGIFAAETNQDVIFEMLKKEIHQALEDLST